MRIVRYRSRRTGFLAKGVAGLGQSPENLSLTSDSRQSPEDLRAERDRFVALAFCSADLLVELDPTGAITFAAGATKVFTGRSPEELGGVRVHDSGPVGKFLELCRRDC
jgi:PAS domain-containing protein